MPHKAARLRELANKAAGSTDGGRAASSFLPTLLIIAALIVTVVVVCVKILFSRRKVERMMSKMRLADEEKIQALEDEELAECEEARQAAQLKIQAIEEEVEDLKEQIQERRWKHAEFVNELHAVVNWDDLKVIDAREDS
jgi:uncharacterized protein HemX